MTADEIRKDLEVLAPGLIGCDPTRIGLINWHMEQLSAGNPFAKSPLDIACWDITGKAMDKPICELLGGRLTASVTAHGVIADGSVDSALEALQQYRTQGLMHFQIKVGVSLENDIERMRAIAETLKPDEILFADANGAWNLEQAKHAASALSGLPIRFEQPCDRYEDCKALAEHIKQPLKLDESIDGIESLVRARAEGVADTVSLKICRHGGITGSRTIRDIAEKLGLALNIEDVFGGQIISAAIAHLALSTRPETLFNATHYDMYFGTRLASDGAWLRDGQIGLSDKPGLGLSVDHDALGDPIFEASRAPMSFRPWQKTAI